MFKVAKIPISEEELQLRKRARRRLVGAVVLVLLVVVFVPMLLDKEPRSQRQDIDIQIPPIPGETQAPSSAPATPAEGAVGESTASAATSSSQDAGASPAPQAGDTSLPPASQQTPEPSAPEAPKQAIADQTATPQPPGFVIQLGAFSNSANAKQLLGKLKAEKIPAYTEPTSEGDKTRVRAGPYASVEAAEKGRERLKTLKLLPGGDAKIVNRGE